LGKAILPSFGFQPAQSDVGLTKTEQILNDWRHSNRSQTAPPPSMRSRAESQIFIAARRRETQRAEILAQQAVDKGLMNSKQAQNLLDRARNNPLLQDFKTVTDFQTAMRAYDAGTKEEKALLFREANDKARRAQSKPWLWEDPKTNAIALKYFGIRPRTPLQIPTPVPTASHGMFKDWLLHRLPEAHGAH
jgi:hypothetical protein